MKGFIKVNGIAANTRHENFVVHVRTEAIINVQSALEEHIGIGGGCIISHGAGFQFLVQEDVDSVMKLMENSLV